MQNYNELEKYITSIINTSDLNMTSYSKNLVVSIENNKIKVIFRFPTAFLVDSNLYFKIHRLLTVPLFPVLSLKLQKKMLVEEIESDDINSARCFVYPFESGVPRRLIFRDYDEFRKSFNVENKKWLIMKNKIIDFNKITSILIGGNSGSGKSYLLNEFLEVLKNMSELTIVDAKKDLPTKFGLKNNLKTLYLKNNKSYNELLEEVCIELEILNNTIIKRQEMLLKNEIKEENLKLKVLVIDEIGALVSLADKKIKENFFKLLTICAVTGRQSKVMLLLSTQRFDANTVPTIVREQANLLIQLGTLNKNTLQYLFLDFENNEILLPIDENLDRGVGLISVSDDISTFLVPTVKKELCYE